MSDASTVKQAAKRRRAEYRALARFIRVLESFDPRARHAAVCWLADAYLGLNVYGYPLLADAGNTGRVDARFHGSDPVDGGDRVK